MKWNRDNLEKLFDHQIATLKDRGTPEQIVEILRAQKGSVLKKASDLSAGRQGCIGDGNIPFLPVIPRFFRSLNDLMAMVRNGEQTGHNYLDPTQISDLVDAPQEPYYIYDVEDGSNTRGKSVYDAEKIFDSQNRSPLTVAEVIALAVHTNVLSKHFVWAAGSRRGDGSVANLWLVGGRPGLGWRWAHSSNAEWGSASCGSR